MTTLMTGSARVQPNARMAAPASTAPNEPSASLSTCASAARVLTLFPCAPCVSAAAATRFTTRPSAAVMVIATALIAGGDDQRSMASARIQNAVSASPTPFANAASTSARRKP
jgi:hypothetical protein